MQAKKKGTTKKPNKNQRSQKRMAKHLFGDQAKTKLRTPKDNQGEKHQQNIKRSCRFRTFPPSRISNKDTFITK